MIYVIKTKEACHYAYHLLRMPYKEFAGSPYVNQAMYVIFLKVDRHVSQCHMRDPPVEVTLYTS